MDNFFLKVRLFKIVATIILLIVSSNLWAQDSLFDIETQKLSSVSKVGLFPKNAPNGLYNFSVSGFYRFFGTYTQMSTPYLLNAVIDDVSRPRSLFIGDDSQLPNFNLNFSGRPAANAFWSFDLFAFQFLEGTVGPAYGGQIRQEQRPTIYNPIIATSKPGQTMGMLLGISTNAGINTDYGNFGLTLGGIQWLSISDLTMASFRGYNRFMLFERNPWDPTNPRIEDRYSSFYNLGNINQDSRWGERAFHGFTLRANDLPGKMDLMVIVGKTELNGGFSPLPNTAFGGKLGRTFSPTTTLHINSINNRVFLDSMSTQEVSSNVHTLQLKTKIKKLSIDAEAGAGKYDSPIHDLDWGETFNLKFSGPIIEKLLDAELQVYRVDPNVVNSNAIYWNTAIAEATPNDLPAGSVGSTAVLRPFSSPILPIGLMTNNRQGVNLNMDFTIGDLKLSVANGISEEIEALSNLVTFGHPVNQLTRSRFWRWDFPSGVGPYQRQAVLFRDTYETMRITDDSLGVFQNTKKFNVLEIQGRYKTKFLHKTLFVNVINRYSSVQKFFAPTTVFTPDAYLRHYSNEMELYYHISQNIIVNSYLGYERIMGNRDTDLSLETGLPRDQEGWGIGFGFDYNLGRNAALYVRHRFFAFEDRSFLLDKYRGQETVVEIKIDF